MMPLCHHLLKSLESRLSDGQISRHALPILSKMSTVYPEILTDGKVDHIWGTQYYIGSVTGNYSGIQMSEVMKIRMRVQTAAKNSNPHDSSPSINILWSKKLCVCKKQIHQDVLTLNHCFWAIYKSIIHNKASSSKK